MIARRTIPKPENSGQRYLRPLFLHQQRPLFGWACGYEAQLFIRADVLTHAAQFRC